MRPPQRPNTTSVCRPTTNNRALCLRIRGRIEATDLKTHGRLSSVDRKIAELLEAQPGGAETFRDQGDAGSAAGAGRVGAVRADKERGRGDGKSRGDDSDSDSDLEGGERDEEAEEKKRAFFAETPEDDVPTKTFAEMDLSRPLLRAVTALGFESPSLVQQRAIPIALMGRDLCACATTGSGKTAAFMLPVLERLLFRPKKVAQTRILVLSPTRELAVQVR